MAALGRKVVQVEEKGSLGGFRKATDQVPAVPAFLLGGACSRGRVPRLENGPVFCIHV